MTDLGERAFDRDGFRREVGLRLRVIRKRLRARQADIASAVGIPRATYANVERGRQAVALDLAWRIAIVLGVSLNKIVPERVS